MAMPADTQEDWGAVSVSARATKPVGESGSRAVVPSPATHSLAFRSGVGMITSGK